MLSERLIPDLYFYITQKLGPQCPLFFESAFVVNSTNPMVSCERSVVAVAHTHTPRPTARPPTAPPRRERDEEMGQRRRSPNTYGRFR